MPKRQIKKRKKLQKEKAENVTKKMYWTWIKSDKDATAKRDFISLAVSVIVMCTSESGRTRKAHAIKVNSSFFFLLFCFLPFTKMCTLALTSSQNGITILSFVHPLMSNRVSIQSFSFLQSMCPHTISFGETGKREEGKEYSLHISCENVYFFITLSRLCWVSSTSVYHLMICAQIFPSYVNRFVIISIALFASLFSHF